MADNTTDMDDVVLHHAQAKSRFLALREITHLWGEHIRAVSDELRNFEAHPDTPPETMAAFQVIVDVIGRSFTTTSERLQDLAEELGAEFELISSEADRAQSLRGSPP